MTIVIDAIKMCEESNKIIQTRADIYHTVTDRKPRLVIINASDDPGNARYIKNKVAEGEKNGIEVIVDKYESNCTNDEILYAINSCNEMNIPVILQKPTFPHLDADLLISKIEGHVDADGFSIDNIGNLNLGNDCISPATPRGVMNLLDFHDVEIEGKIALVIGRSNHVGKPMTSEFIKRGATTICANSKTKDLKSLVMWADIVVSCVGQRHLLEPTWFKEGSTIIGVGFTYDENGKQHLDFEVDDVVAVGKASMVSNRVNCTGKATVNALIRNSVDLCISHLVDGRFHHDKDIRLLLDEKKHQKDMCK